jgi:hypothetical protein
MFQSQFIYFRQRTMYSQYSQNLKLSTHEHHKTRTRNEILNASIQHRKVLVRFKCMVTTLIVYWRMGTLKNIALRHLSNTGPFLSFMWVVPKVRYKWLQVTGLKSERHYCTRTCWWGWEFLLWTNTVVHVQACKVVAMAMTVRLESWTNM